VVKEPREINGDNMLYPSISGIIWIRRAVGGVKLTDDNRKVTENSILF
jgi:hypothetical protein